MTPEDDHSLARQAAQKLQGDEFSALVREIMLEIIRSDEGQKLVAEIKARRQERELQQEGCSS